MLKNKKVIGIIAILIIIVIAILWGSTGDLETFNRSSSSVYMCSLYKVSEGDTIDSIADSLNNGVMENDDFISYINKNSKADIYNLKEGDILYIPYTEIKVQD